MISEGSCDPEDWSYDAENLHLQLYNLVCRTKLYLNYKYTLK